MGGKAFLSPETGALYLDNYNVRLLGGLATLLVPLGGVNASHFDQAVSLLHQFDIVIPLDKVASKRAQSDMDRVLGWHVDGRFVHMNEHKIHFSQEDVRMLQHINRFDIALYRLFA